MIPLQIGDYVKIPNGTSLFDVAKVFDDKGRTGRPKPAVRLFNEWDGELEWWYEDPDSWEKCEEALYAKEARKAQLHNQINQMGQVNFPINSPEYENTNEGGLIVALYAAVKPEVDRNEEMAFFFHHFCTEMPGGVSIQSPEWESADLENRRIACCYIIGGTNWSGWSASKEEIFQATFDDLTDEGKQLYQLLARLNPDCDLYLITALDT